MYLTKYDNWAKINVLTPTSKLEFATNKKKSLIKVKIRPIDNNETSMMSFLSLINKNDNKENDKEDITTPYLMNVESLPLPSITIKEIYKDIPTI